MKKSLKLMLFAPLAVLILLGCETMTHDQIKAKVDLPPPTLDRPEYIFHKVMPGETMATIARWYSGKEGTWREISEHNPGMNPHNLKKDDIVKVPAELATAHSEQPKFSTAPRQKPKKAAVTAKPEGQPEEDASPDEAVFGPR